MLVCVIQATVQYSCTSFGMPYFMYSVSLGKENETVIVVMIHDNSCAASYTLHNEFAPRLFEYNRALSISGGH